jgi:DNA-binding MarR family transcriptional regulator
MQTQTIEQDAPRTSVVAAEAAPLLRLEEFLPYRLTVCSSLVSGALSRVYAERHKIGVPEWRVLVTLGQFPALTGRDIGAYGQMHKTKVSRAVTVLERKEWVARKVNSRDRREALLALTPLGRSIYGELAPLALEFTRKLLDVLDPVEHAALDRALKKLSSRSEALSGQSFIGAAASNT